MMFRNFPKALSRVSGAGGTSTFWNAVLLLVLQTTTWANIAINATASPTTNTYLSLHTGTPAAGNQSTSEAAYTSYARQACVRATSSPGWTVASNVATLAANTNFPASTGSPSETETFFGLGKSVSGATDLYFYGAISPTIAVTAAGVTPQITSASTITGT
jgi:hypothetical protein